MVKHSPPISTSNPLQHYQAITEVTLDHWKHGDITQEEAISRFDVAAALLVDTLRQTFLIRLRNLEAFQTSRGTTVEPRKGE